MEISNEIICKIFAQYPKSPIAICEPNTEPVSHYLEGVDFTLNEIIAERVNWNPKWIKLILKPLSKITNEDAIEISKLGGMDLSPTQRTQSYIDFGKNIVGKYLRAYDDGVYGIEWLRIFQYLQSKEYALPYMEYSVDDLVNAGIYQL